MVVIMSGAQKCHVRALLSSSHRNVEAPDGSWSQSNDERVIIYHWKRKTPVVKGTKMWLNKKTTLKWT